MGCNMSSVGGLIGGLLGALEAAGPSVLALFIGSELANQARRGTRLAFGLLGTLPIFIIIGLISSDFPGSIGVGVMLFILFGALVGALAAVRFAIEEEIRTRKPEK
jgi:hypothetical protein